MAEIRAMADYWQRGSVDKSKLVTITKKDGKILVNGQEATMGFNGIQLWFTVKPKHTYRLFDGRTESDLTIKEMHRQLSKA